ncbi:MAG: imidazole glycerol phosphate synthase subunit HisH [Shewanella psychromarinicola]|uniref:Imidazole glycerol phosphate synthase subunit HisH n=2 Tax=Shewanellaceae TaxID=267890 RepID=A0A3N4EAJ0_9GAMM|nr:MULTISPECIES: imidazole glycerol phosphate synthase subunit HisH [Shewanella]AZG37550.1 imidazole glycerol phosphate synthase subunit HisH [Shewanella psychromarinicola]MCL1083234.1 imidazole glycerol phosphate synthase subunit HisH [Shewanella psychromarinicola]PKG80450.1 imidazole glycerol phosphate synthase subunit HisH [Shewanella sp. Actino-trap-3]RPA35103.1 imidazole glycerol phosphate synthase subunit HisH [Shewanella psychromarinicola]
MANDLTVIIDTGCANLSSVRFAFERLNANVIVSADFDVIRSAARVVLPGVGTAGAAMDALKQKNLVELIKSLTQPVMGVCLGMQMLASLSNEHGGRSEQSITCLGLVPTDIGDLDSKGLPLPHMGWNQIEVSDHPLFVGIENGSYVYFVHSYRAPISEYTLARSTYGESFSAAIGKGNFFGVQFHPEKSAKVGAKILQNFLNMGTPQ